jgi:hypothetical protein
MLQCNNAFIAEMPALAALGEFALDRFKPHPIAMLILAFPGHYKTGCPRPDSQQK